MPQHFNYDCTTALSFWKPFMKTEMKFFWRLSRSLPRYMKPRGSYSRYCLKKKGCNAHPNFLRLLSATPSRLHISRKASWQASKKFHLSFHEGFSKRQCSRAVVIKVLRHTTELSLFLFLCVFSFTGVFFLLYSCWIN